MIFFIIVNVDFALLFFLTVVIFPQHQCVKLSVKLKKHRNSLFRKMINGHLAWLDVQFYKSCWLFGQLSQEDFEERVRVCPWPTDRIRLCPDQEFMIIFFTTFPKTTFWLLPWSPAHRHKYSCRQKHCGLQFTHSKPTAKHLINNLYLFYVDLKVGQLAKDTYSAAA